MLSEAGHKEAAEAAKRAEQSTGRDLSAEAAKLKEQHRDGAGPANAGDKKHEQASSGVSVLEGEGTKEEGAFLVHATRGKTRCTVAASPDSTVTTSSPPHLWHVAHSCPPALFHKGAHVDSPGARGRQECRWSISGRLLQKSLKQCQLDPASLAHRESNQCVRCPTSVWRCQAKDRATDQNKGKESAPHLQGQAARGP